MINDKYWIALQSIFGAGNPRAIELALKFNDIKDLFSASKDDIVKLKCVTPVELNKLCQFNFDDAKSIIPAKIKFTAKKYAVSLRIAEKEWGLYAHTTITTENRSFVRRERKNPISGARIMREEKPPIIDAKVNLPPEGKILIIFEVANSNRKVIIILRTIRTSMYITCCIPSPPL